MKMPKAAAVLLFSLLMIKETPGLLPDSGPPPSTLRIGIDSFPTSLNPVYSTTETSQAIMNKVYNGLFYFDEKGNPQEELVEKVLTQNQREYPEIVLELKKNVLFSTGKELESEDVVQTVKLLQDKAFKYPYISNLHFLRKVEKIDRYRLNLTLAYRFAAWKNYLTFKVLNGREIKAASPETFRDMILSGTGPYQLKTIKRPSKITLERNEASLQSGSGPQPGGEKTFRFLDYIVLSYTQLSPLKLINNEIDICELQPENVEAYRHTRSKQWREGFCILRYKKFGYTYLVFNLRNSLMTRNLRYFFYNELINGDFLDRFLRDRGERVNSPFLLLSTKVKPGRFEITPLETPVPLKILTNSESKLRKEFVLFLREKLKPFKILLQPVFLEYQSFLDYLKKGSYDVAVSGFMLDIDYDMSDILAGGAFFNYAHFRSSAMDTLLERGLKESDPRKREEIYLEAHRVWLENQPFLPLFNLYYYVGVSPRIEVPAQTYELVGSSGDFLYNILHWRKKNV